MAPRKGPRARALAIAGSWLVWWALSMALWLLLTSTIAGSEAIAGVGAAAIAATFAEIVETSLPLRFRPRLRWFGGAWLPPVRVVTDTGLVFAALWGQLTGTRRVRGSLRAIPFEHGGDRNPEDAARRALVLAGVSVAPNTVAIGVDRLRDELLVHELVPRAGAVRKLLGRT